MTPYSLRHLSDPVLLRELSTIVARDHTNTAAMLAHLAEVDARRLYCPAGHPSMYAWCVQELGLSEDGAFKRIRVARAAREFPAIFVAVETGRLNLTAVLLLVPFLSAKTGDELIAATAGKSKSAIEQMLAERFPRPDVPTQVTPISPPAPAPVVPATNWLQSQSIATIELPAPPRPKIAPLAPERFALQVTIDQSTRDDLRYAQELLGHQVAPGNVAEVLGRALKSLIRELEKGKFAKTERPSRTARRTKAISRHIPAAVKREVWERDGGQCTFVGGSGHRCQSRARLEFDHAQEVARGGKSVVSNVRLLCRAHNQHAAARSFGAGFMDQKRRADQRSSEKRRAAEDSDLVRALRKLGFRAEEVRLAAARCESIPGASLEAQVRAALSFLAPTARRTASALGAG